MIKINKDIRYLIPVLFVPSNILAVVLGLAYAFNKLGKRAGFLPLIVALSILLASINTTKIPEGDLSNYKLISSELASKDIGYVVAVYGKEIGYYLLNWLHVHLFGMDWLSWVFVFSFFFYFTLLKSVEILAANLPLSNPTIISLILIVAFSPLIFSQSAHLVRQYLAGAIAMYGVARFLGQKSSIIVFLAAILFHVSAAIFVAVPLSKLLSGRSQKRAVILLVALVLFMAFLIQAASQFLVQLQTPGALSIVQYGIARAVQDEFHQLLDAGAALNIFSAMSLVMSIAGLYIGATKKIFLSQDVATRWSVVLVFQVILSASVLLLAQAGLNEPAVRFFQYVVILFPAILAMFCVFSKKTRNFVFFLAFAAPVLMWVYPYVWSYPKAIEVVFFPSLYIILGGVN